MQPKKWCSPLMFEKKLNLKFESFIVTWRFLSYLRTSIKCFDKNKIFLWALVVLIFEQNFYWHFSKIVSIIQLILVLSDFFPWLDFIILFEVESHLSLFLLQFLFLLKTLLALFLPLDQKYRWTTVIFSCKVPTYFNLFFFHWNTFR